MKLKGEKINDEVFVKSQLEHGTKVEMEHTNCMRVARTIAKIHLMETGKKNKKTGKISSRYYPELKKMERKLKKW